MFGALSAQAAISEGKVIQIACQGEVVLSSKNAKCANGAPATLLIEGPAIGQDAFLFSPTEQPEFGHGDRISVQYDPATLILQDVRKHACSKDLN